MYGEVFRPILLKPLFPGSRRQQIVRLPDGHYGVMDVPEKSQPRRKFVPATTATETGQVEEMALSI